MRPNALENHLDGLFDQAVNKARISIAGVTREAALENSLGSSRLAFAYVEAIEAQGEDFIQHMLQIYKANKSAVFGIKTQYKFLKYMDDYISEASSWVPDPVGFSGSLRGVFERDFTPMSVRLKNKLELEMYLLDPPAWWRRSPTGIISFVRKLVFG